MQEQLQELSLQKNIFYRNSYRKVVSLIIALGILAIFLLTLLVYLTVRKQVLMNYASTTTGEVIELHPLSEPVISNTHLLEWATLVARQAYSFSFLNYQQQLEKVKPYFTDDAWDKFQVALNSSGLLSTIQSKKIIMETVVTASPTILYSGVLHGRYSWRIQMPILVTYATASEQTKSKYVVTMNISRVPVLDVPEGIQVTDFTLSDYKTQ